MDLLPDTEIVSLAFRLWFTVCVFRIFRKVLYTAPKFHTEDHEHSCRVEYPNGIDSLSRIDEYHRLFKMLTCIG